MTEFVVNFAGLNIEVHCNYDYTCRFCREYLTENAPDFSVSVSEEAIQEEIDISPYNPSAPYAESICAYREMAEKFPFYDRCVFHGAVISYDGKGYIFTAPSGTGKTTHISLWQKYLDGVEIVNGDKPVLHITEDCVTAYATPYAGKEGFQNHTSAELCGICLIEQAKENTIRRLEPSEILMRLMGQIYRPFSAEGVVKTLDLMDKMLRRVPVYLLGCDMSEDAVRCSFEAMTGLPFDERKKDED